MIAIDVIIACHNRKSHTIRLLNQLHSPSNHDVKFNIYLVDDGSTDGTSVEILNSFPEILVHQGNGSLYWAASMALAESLIVAPSNWLLWINDDTILDESFLNSLKYAIHQDDNCIWVGEIFDFDGNFLYGAKFKLGMLLDNLESRPASDFPSQQPKSFNGNFVLIPRLLREAIGPIDGNFSHGYADVDYGLRASELGIAIKVLPTRIGTVSDRTEYGISRARTSFKYLLNDPKGQPISDQLRLFRRHARFLWPLYVAIPFLRVIKFKTIKLFRFTITQ